MAKDARLPIAGWRNEALALPIRVVGMDLTGKVVRGQVRLAPGTPGAPLLDLASVTNANAEGIRFVGAVVTDGVPTSTLMLRVNKTSMQALPATGELGSPTPLSYAIQIAGTTRLWGPFVVLDSAIDSDNNVVGRQPGYGSANGGYGVADGLTVTIGDDGVTVSIDGLGELAQLLRAASGYADAASAAANAAQVAQVSAEAARDASRVSAQAAGVSAAVADTARAAVEVAISKVPSDTRLLLEAVAMSVLRGVAGDTPVGRLAYLSEPGREGVWQLRAGDYSARVARDALGFRYLAMDAQPASQRCWERIIPDGVFQATWTGLNAATPDALAMLRSALKLIDAYSTLRLPGYRIPIGGNEYFTTPSLPILLPGTRLQGCGDASWLDYIGTATPYALLQAAADDVVISDLRTSFVAPNNSAGNPASIMISSFRTADTPREVRNVQVRDVLCDRTSVGLIAFINNVEGDPDKGYTRPANARIENMRVVTNGIGIALSGAKDAYVRHCDLSYTTDLPSNAPSAKHMGMRVLGMEGAQIEDVVTHGFPIAVGMDASYLAPFRLYNQDITFLRPRFYDSQTVFQIYECRGTLRITEPRTSCSLGSTDYSVFADAQTNREVSTVAGKPTELGNLIVERADVQGVSMFISQDGTMGRLEVSTNAVIGNASTSNDDKRRGAVICGGLVGFPSSTKIADNDFMMTGPDAAPSIVVGCDQPGDLVEVRGNALPESPTTTPIFANGLPAFYSDAREQRPFTGRVNLGTNSIHRVGTLAQVRDGTPMPAPAKPVVAIWTRNQVKVIEGPDNIFTKNAGGSDYDAAFWSAEKYASDFELVYRLGQISARLRVGLASNPGQAPYGNMDWCIEYQAAPNGYVLSSGAYLSLVGAYDPTTIERWRRQGSRLIFSRGGVDMFDTAVSPDTAFALQAAFARVNDSIEILRFGAI